MRKTVALLLVLVFLTVSFCITLLPANATSKTVVVPDDYPTIADALGNATAGDTIFFKEGTYEGPINRTLRIDKPLTLIGQSAESTILKLHPYYTETWICTQSFINADDAIIVSANDVKIVNLTLRFISDIRVNGDRVQITGNDIHSGSTARGLIIAGSECNVTNNTVLGRINLHSSFNFISHNNFYSLVLQSSDNNTVDSNGFKYLQLSASNNNTILRNNISYENVQYIIDIYNSTNNIVHDNRVEAVYWNTNLNLGAQAQNNTFYGNTFIGENELVIADDSAYDNSWDNSTKGNYWSNYNGTDNNHDGIGDSPYIIDANNKDNCPLMKPVATPSSPPPNTSPTPTPQVPQPEPFPTVTVIAASVAAIVLIGGLLVYFKKRKREVAFS
jgi:hypothetical protein